MTLLVLACPDCDFRVRDLWDAQILIRFEPGIYCVDLWCEHHLLFSTIVDEDINAIPTAVRRW